PHITCSVAGVYFFSSRRRHTRFSRDWSSDVCSSDLLDYLLSDEAQQVFLDNAFRGHDGRTGDLLTEENGVLPAEPVELSLPSAKIGRASGRERVLNSVIHKSVVKM